MSNIKLLAVDLFTGAGGLSLGFLQTGQVEIAAAVENNESAQSTYRRNHESDKGDTCHRIKYFKDIRKLDFKGQIKNDFQKIDIVFGGPPCQGFSNANRQKTELISTNNQLVKEYVRAIQELEPNAFVMENVKAMKSSKHKFFYSTKDYKEVVEELEINLLPEKIILGKATVLTDELIRFLNGSTNVELSAFTINDKNLFSKISHISRKEKEADVYLIKAENVLKKFLSTWMEQHEVYWSENYQEQWQRLGDLIKEKDHTDSSKRLLFNSLKEIIEIQKILMRMNEIKANNIEITGILHDNKNLYIEVQTYGVLNYLTSKFKKLGYKINEEHIVNAAHFGAPQLRERLILIGVKKEFVGEKPVELPRPIIKESSKFNTVKHAIEDLEDLEPFTLREDDKPIIKSVSQYINNPLLHYLSSNVKKVENHVITESTPIALERFKMLEPGQNFHHLGESYKQTYSDPGRTQNTVYLRLNYCNPSGTVLNVRKSMWIHPRKNRAISIREAARLQTFPDDFVFEGSKDSQYQQIGNAVPPLLGRALAEQVLKYLGKPPIKTLESIIMPRTTSTNV